MFTYLLVFLSVLSTTAADYLAKQWSLSGGSWWMVAVALYSFTGLVFMYSLKFGELTIVNAVWTVGVFVLTTCMGLFLFHEKLSPLQSVALVIGFTSIVLFVIDEIWGAGASIK